jgi:mRNA-degrading endonuclease toxin of MazEF toxin-antitoxin module
MKDFDSWIAHKKTINEAPGKLYSKRDIWWCSLGVNVGFEQDGTGKSYERPVVVLRGFSRAVCLVVPLTTSTKENKYHVALGDIDGKPAAAIISQIRLVDTKRFIDKIGMLDKVKFEEMKNAVKALL